MKSLAVSLIAVLLLALAVPPTNAQSEFVKPENYTYDEPVVFNQWCEELKEMYGPTCVCETRYGESNNINGLDLDHEINCDPLQGKSTCIANVTINSARVWLRATSIGEVGNFQTIRETAILDFYVFLDETSIDTISFRFNDRIGQRRTNCLAVFGAVDCARCGACDAPPNNKSLDYPVHLGPADLFRGISGFCRYGNGPDIGIFNTCENGTNVLTDIFWNDLEITAEDQIGQCPWDIEEEENGDPIDAEESASTTLTTVPALLVAAVASLASVVAHLA